jgi:hypothetical protein
MFKKVVFGFMVLVLTFVFVAPTMALSQCCVPHDDVCYETALILEKVFEAFGVTSLEELDYLVENGYLDRIEVFATLVELGIIAPSSQNTLSCCDVEPFGTDCGCGSWGWCCGTTSCRLCSPPINCPPSCWILWCDRFCASVGRCNCQGLW